MTSQVRFDPPNVDCLVASGTTLASAAERLGVSIDLACGGRGECDRCAVVVFEGADGLSAVTDAERRELSAERLSASVRLACQARVQGADCAARVVEQPAEPRRGAASEDAVEAARARIRDAFSSLPTADQLSTALELQMQVAGDLLSAVVAAPLALGERLLASLLGSEPPSEKAPGDDNQGTKDKDPSGGEPGGSGDSHEQF
jgi:ferredoxin, 2Fe-2S